MTGKPYSFKEMKIITDYLIEHKAYGEIKGRKMWIDFANSKHTTRTWQSLKETFLKRILPDIHNPYYKLTIEQINSFRQGYDVAERNKNKLEIHTVNDDSSSSNAENQKTKDIDSGNSNQEGKTTGEDIKCSKIPTQTRSSAETVILDNCYETTEDLQRDLESPIDDRKKENIGIAAPSLRDCITYSEPLTPMLQEVLDDFASEPEESDKEPQMVIESKVADTGTAVHANQELKSKSEVTNLESTVATDVAKNAKGLSADIVEEVLLSEIKEFGNQATKKQLPTKKTQKVPPEVQNKQLETMESNIDKNKEEDTTKTDTPTADLHIAATNVVETINVTDSDPSIKEKMHTNEKENNESLEKFTQNYSNTTTDSLLPNNPEAFNKRNSKETIQQTKSNDHIVIESSEDVDKTKAIRKRSVSQDTAKGIENKKKKVDDNKTGDTEKVTTNGPDNDGKLDNKVHSNDDNIEKNEIPQNTKTEKRQESNVLHTQENPSTSRAAKIPSKPQKRNNVESKKPAEIENPCLKNVSLFDEQFNNTKYTSSETSEVEAPIPKILDKQKEDANKKTTDVVMLKSHSESESNDNRTIVKNSRDGVASCRKQREKALANVFGFSSGAVTSNRKRRLSHHKKRRPHNSLHHTLDSASSEWTSETDSDMYVSPPRGRKNRHTKKFLKPQSARILSLEEEGGLFVMYGKKIYPLVKDGKIVKNYLTYLPDSDSEDEEGYWKLKYVEEKKKSDELKKLLQQAKEPSRDTKSPVLQSKPPRNSTTSYNSNRQTSDNMDKELCIPGHIERVGEVPQEKIKIKFTKNNEEVHLEGHWPQIHPVLAQVVEIFHKEPPVNETKSKMLLDAPEQGRSSGNSTPVVITAIDPEVHETVNEIEKEIFNEIEKRDKEEQTVLNGPDTNVTKRKPGRPRKSSSSGTISPAKRLKSSTPQDDIIPTDNTATKPVAQSENNDETTNRITRQSKTPKKVLNESVKTDETKSVKTRRSKQKIDSTDANEEDNVRYMLPPKSKRQNKSASNTKAKEQKPQKSTKKIGKIFSSPDNFSLNSMDSTQGYQDSDISPLKGEIRKKKLINRSYPLRSKSQYHRNFKRKSHPYLYCDSSNDSSNLSATPEKATAPNSSLNPEAYKSESYELLMPQVRRSFRHLEPINEVSPMEINTETKNRSVVNHIHSDIASSSTVSLPLSPELSVVENLSVSKDMLSYVEDYPTINETQRNEANDQEFCSKYMISGVDASIPLMQQDCGIECCIATTVEKNNKDATNVVTESLLNKICSFNLGGLTPMTENLNQKLRNLLLESAKKIETENLQTKENMMEVDDINIETRSKTGNKKRSSTPRKRKGTKKSAVTKIPVVEEEHVESCSYSGRKSCPPLIQAYLCEDNALDEQIANLTVTDSKDKRRTKIKKDIIKVKIVRPKNKHGNAKSSSNKNASKVSTCTDSGINETESGVFVPINDSVDFIHNHSETCLHANECVGDSIEFLENSKSVISLNSTSLQSNEWQSELEYTDAAAYSHAPEWFCTNAQDVNSFCNEAKANSQGNVSDTVYHSPAGTELFHNSLITEDLSDDTQPPDRPSKWYLFSDQETTSTNIVSNDTTGPKTSSFGANLKQIFPISCAVPNLSTITEMSKESDCNSRKPTLDTDGETRDDLNSRKAKANSQGNVSDTVYHSPAGTELFHNSLITEDLSDDTQPPDRPSKWYLFSDQETTSTNIVSNDTTGPKISSFGANLKQIFPISCAVPNLSTITEMSKESDCNSRKPTLDTDGETRDDLNSRSILDSNF